MKLNIFVTFAIINFSILVNGKGGGRGSGGRGGASTDSEGGRSSSSNSKSSGSSNSFNSRGSSTHSNVGSYSFSKGSSSNYYRGGYGVTHSSYYTKSSYYYYNYYPTYDDNWIPGYSSGYYNTINPDFVYWYLLPSYSYLGYNCHYFRYNVDNGAYYVPLFGLENNNSSLVSVNATAYTDSTNNFHTYWSYSTAAGYPTIENAYFATSDPAAQPADFYFKLNFWKLVEFNDTNSNGGFDPASGDTVIYSVLLNKPTVSWSALSFANLTLNDTSGKYYLEGSTTATFANPNAQTFFNVRILYRTSTFQLNGSSWALPLEPFSANFEFSIQNYTFANANTSLALITVLAVPSYIPSLTMDINSTTPLDVAAQIKTNTSVGTSIGDYSEGRLEWPSAVSVTNITNISGFLNPDPLGSDPADQTALMNTSVGAEYASVFAFVFPPNSMDRIAGTANTSGFTFLDTDVLSSDGLSGMKRMGVFGIFVVFASTLALV